MNWLRALGRSSVGRYVKATLLLASSLFVATSLLFFSADDPSFLVQTSYQAACSNPLGWWGSQVAAGLLFVFGSASWLVVPLLALSGLAVIKGSWRDQWSSLFACAVVLLVFPIFASSIGLEWYDAVTAGGLWGSKSYAWLFGVLGEMRMIQMLLVGALLVANIALFGVGWVPSLERYWGSLWNKSRRAGRFVVSYYRRLRDSVAPAVVIRTETSVKKEDFESVVKEVLQEATPEPAVEGYRLPDLRSLVVRQTGTSRSEDAQGRARLLEDKLEKFGVRGRVTAVTVGPVVTLFEYEPASDVPVNKIVAREDDLALALEALSLRIIAPMPGRSVVGFEVANVHRAVVPFAELLLASRAPTIQLPLALGKSSVGDPVLLDLAAQPHLLVAGATGSGKSVALNSMILSLLATLTPDEVRLVLIDPKRLEFSRFADVPHLLFPIVTDPAEAVVVLQAVITIMEERYQQMAVVGVRNVAEYNRAHTPFPFLVVIVDELADLMMTAGKEVERAVARIAQKSRAAGIHLILATQRPSVDVITGMIKANFPARIACKVTSQIDSRTILDTAGAEKLLGKGDMLMLDTQGRIVRIHGAYVRDDELQYVVDYVKRQRAVVYKELPRPEASGSDLSAEDATLYTDLVAFVKTIDEVSISLLQRKFRIGYNRSARMMELLEAHGIIMPSTGGKQRKVLH